MARMNVAKKITARFTKKIVTLHIDNDNIRLLQASHKRAERWVEISPGFDLYKPNTAADEAAVAARIRQLFESAGIRSKRTAVSISGLHCIVRSLSLPQLARAMLPEAVLREAKRVLPVALEEVYSSWQTVPAPQGKTGVLFVAVPRQEIDAVIRILRLIEIRPSVVEMKPLALARLLKEDVALAVDVQPGEFDIVIVSEGVPQLVRTVALGAEDRREKLKLVKDEVIRTVQFYAANSADGMPVSGIPVFVSGEVAADPDFRDALSAGLGVSVSRLPTSLTSPEEFNSICYAGNIGLTNAQLKRRAAIYKPGLNVLPIRYRPEAVSPWRLVAVSSFTIAFGLFFMLGTLVQASSEDIGRMRTRVDVTSQFLVKKQAQKRELSTNIADLEKTIAQVTKSQQALLVAFDTLEKQRRLINDDLRTVLSQTSAVSYSRISHDGGKVVIEGQAENEANILAHAGELRGTGRFSEVSITSIQWPAGNEMSFVLVLKAGP